MFLKPLVAWIWIGILIVVLGTFVALTPNMTAALAASRSRVPAEAAAALAASKGGD